MYPHRQNEEAISFAESLVTIPIWLLASTCILAAVALQLGYEQAQKLVQFVWKKL